NKAAQQRSAWWSSKSKFSVYERARQHAAPFGTRNEKSVAGWQVDGLVVCYDYGGRRAVLNLTKFFGQIEIDIAQQRPGNRSWHREYQGVEWLITVFGSDGPS